MSDAFVTEDLDWFDHERFCGHPVEPDWRCLLLKGHPSDHEGFDAWRIRSNNALGGICE